MNLGPYPSARRSDAVERLPGHTVPDPYRWLEDDGSAETRTWSAAQDALLAQYRGTPGHAATEARLVQRLAALLGAGAVGSPVWRGERWFAARREGAAVHAVVDLAEPHGGRTPLLDPMRIDPSGATTLDSWQPSIEGDLLAYQVSAGGAEESVLRVLDVAGGEVVDGPIDRARYSPVAWLPGGAAFYYVRRLHPDLVPADEARYHRRVWLHRVGTDPDTDVEVFGAGLDATTYFGVSVSRDGRWLIVSASTGTAPRTDVWIADLTATAPEQPLLEPVAVGLDAEFGAWVGRDGRLYLLTDLDAPRGRLAVADPRRPGPEHWTTLLEEDTEAVLCAAVLLDDGAPTAPEHPEVDGTGTRPVAATELVALWRRHALSEVTVHDPATGALLDDEPHGGGRVPLPGLGTVTGSATGRPAAASCGSAGPTTPARRRSGATTRVPARSTCGPSRPVGCRRCRRCAPSRSRTPVPTAHRCGWSSWPGPTGSTATGVRS